MRLILATILFVSYTILSFDLYAAPLFPLEITNIKQAGTGNPAIPSTNRIFRAHPGVEYNIKVGAVGGVYPYIYALNNAPSGMSINATTGVLVWDNPQSDAPDIVVTVTDTEATSVNATWSIDVTTDGFVFVDASHTGAETGAISAPYSSLGAMLTATFDNGSSDKIVYFRGGEYPLVEHHNTSAGGLNLEKNPTKWIGYPGEDVIFQGGNATRVILQNGANCYMDSLRFDDMVNYVFAVFGDKSYMTFRRIFVDGLSPSDDVNNNYGFVHTSSAGISCYDLISENNVRDFHHVSGIGSLYKHNRLLIEYNNIYDQSASISPKGISATLGIAVKATSDYTTVRNNSVILTNGMPFGSSINSLIGIKYIDVCFNYFKNVNGSEGAYMANPNPTNLTTGDISSHWMFRRNTVVGNTAKFRFNPCESNTPMEHSSNVFQVATNTIKSVVCDGITYANNIEGTGGIVDENGMLTPAYAAYVGSVGWQIDENWTPTLPPDGDPEGPTLDPDPTTPTTSGPILRTGQHLLRVGDSVLRVQ